MKALCILGAVIFGLDGFSCFYNLITGGSPSSPIQLFFFGIAMFGLTALCIMGARKAGKKQLETGHMVIEKTRIIDAYGKKSTSSAAMRGTVGGAVAGPVGAIVGASTAKDKRSTTFLIFYKDGKRITRTVANNSAEYQKYIQYLED
ncbi:MAG: hypothetical protein NC489_28080 [Ruminococcus flavefaciens]|nr:hypothetical protein [Ruminococcus flavefaciens]